MFLLSIEGKQGTEYTYVKWTPVFIEAQKDGIQIVHYTNPITGENDITMLVFDNRTLAATAPTELS